MESARWSQTVGEAEQVQSESQCDHEQTADEPQLITVQT